MYLYALGTSLKSKSYTHLFIYLKGKIQISSTEYYLIK